MEFESIQEGLQSDNPDALMKATDDAVSSVDSTVRILIKRFETSELRHLIAERLWKCGSIICPPLRELVENTNDNDVKFQACLLLLFMKDNFGVAHLATAINDNSNYHIGGATRLMQAGIDVTDKIIQRLRSCALIDKDTISGLLGVLEDFKKPLPADLIKKFSSPEADWYIQKLVEPFQSKK